MAEYNPKLVCFSCKFGWDYLTEEPGLASRIANWIPVVCSGKIDTSHILKAFRAGADGVLILGCSEGSLSLSGWKHSDQEKSASPSKVLRNLWH